MRPVAAGYYPKATEEKCHQLVHESVPLAKQLMSKLDVNPYHPPLAQAPGPDPDAAAALVDGSDAGEAEVQGTSRSPKSPAAA